MKKGLSGFISDAAEREHREYLASLKCRASILKKDGIDIYSAYPLKKSASPRLTSSELVKIRKLAQDIRMHEIYFSSFVATYAPSQILRAQYGSENNFAYLITELSEQLEGGFIGIYVSNSGRVGFSEWNSLPKGAKPCLAIDLAEHAYFRDYGFQRAKYLRAALAHLDLKRLAMDPQGKDEEK